MEFEYFLNSLAKKKLVVLSFVVFFLAMATIFVMSVPLKYKASSTILIVQDFKEETNSYVITQSNKQLSDILAEVVDSSKFLKEVTGSKYELDKGYFNLPVISNKTDNKWAEGAEAMVSNESGGVVDIALYHTDKSKLEELAQKVNFFLKNNHTNYHGFGDRVNIKVINEPNISNWPVEPNVPLIYLLAALLGVAVAGSYVYIFYCCKEKIELKRVPGVEESWPAEKETHNSSIYVKQVDEKEFFSYKGGENLKREEQASLQGQDEYEQQEKEMDYDQGTSKNNKFNKLGAKDIEERGDMRNIFS